MRIVRHARGRKKTSGTVQRPRLSVFRSLNHIYAQVIDDGQRHTLASASSLDKEVVDKRSGKTKKEVSTLVGSLIARHAKEKGISRVVLDRGGYMYLGRIKALAEAARKGGLEF